MNLSKWAIKWGVPYVALEDLRRQMGVATQVPNHSDDSSEAMAQSRVVLEASRLGGRLWRNNVGAFKDDRDALVRYGLCNDTKGLNKICKSSDLIGPMPVVVTMEMVGCTFAVFTAREMKAPGWRYSGDAHEEAQLKFINLVNSLGGDAAFCTGEGSL